MKYPKCVDASIGHEGDSVTLRFEDNFSMETSTITMASMDWHNILTYRDAYEKPERMALDAHRNLMNFWNVFFLEANT